MIFIDTKPWKKKFFLSFSCWLLQSTKIGSTRSKFYKECIEHTKNELWHNNCFLRNIFWLEQEQNNTPLQTPSPRFMWLHTIAFLLIKSQHANLNHFWLFFDIPINPLFFILSSCWNSNLSMPSWPAVTSYEWWVVGKDKISSNQVQMKA